ncbi:MAG: hypothetical protein ABJZ55_10595 [Fuerstiella sp.]
MKYLPKKSMTSNSGSLWCELTMAKYQYANSLNGLTILPTFVSQLNEVGEPIRLGNDELFGS